MKLTALIDRDCKRLNNYFHRLFDVLHEAIAEDQNAPFEALDLGADESQASYHSFSSFIKPDMLMNIYSLVVFWVGQICENQRKKNNISISYEDIKGKNELDRYQKYLTKYAGLNIQSAKNSYDQLGKFRKVRNQLIHNGGHVSSEKENEFSSISGIKLVSSLIVIEDDFIWTSFDHAKIYLHAVALAVSS